MGYSMNKGFSDTNTDFMEKAVNAAIRIAVIALMIAWCFAIIRPFISPICWGVIIAIALYPGFHRIVEISGGRQGIIAIVVTLLLLLILAGPIILLAGVIVDNAHVLAEQLRSGALNIPPPPKSVRTWPLVGGTVAYFWTLASANLENAVAVLAPQLKLFAGWLLTAVASAGISVLQFIFAIIIAGILLANATAGHRIAHDIAKRFAGDKGEELTRVAEATVHGVARGVLGVALIQAILAGMGFMVADVPGAGLLALLCLFLAVIQIGPTLVLIPVVVYVYSIDEGMFASAFLVWNVFVALIDNILKPLLMGRGVDIPMAVIFLGAIGGMLLSGIIGLFVGAVVLALGYKLFQAWLDEVREAA